MLPNAIQILYEKLLSKYYSGNIEELYIFNKNTLFFPLQSPTKLVRTYPGEDKSQ